MFDFRSECNFSIVISYHISMNNNHPRPNLTRSIAVSIGEDTSQIAKISAQTLRWSGILLIASVWLSAALFGLYILAFYASPLYRGEMMDWNRMLPNLYRENAVAATTGIGAHFLAGGVILLLGSIQLVDWIRIKYPSVHRGIGKLYLVSSLVASIGGLVFISIRGTVGGLTMDIGFSIYGVLMFLATVLTYRYAVKGQFERHSAWALRLYALAIGSWLYRMDYGFWTLLTGGLGRAGNFSGPFDQIMDFFFYVPNLMIGEVFIRVKTFKAAPFLKFAASLMLLVATGFVLLGTFFMTRFSWGPAIIGWFQMDF